MTFLEDRDLEDVPTIPEYYRGKTVFITGGTGFMGKVLLEKLLYSCTDLDRIYLLMRYKKGVKPENRLPALYASPCYDRLRKERPGVFESKVFFVAGDCSELGLGLSEEDRALIVNRTNIIFHVAASVRFDDPLKVAAKLNLRGTKEIVELAKDVRNLESVVHVSTSYCNTNRDPIEEILYPALADWRQTLDICDTLDDQTVDILTSKYLGEMPNTYVFTKQLAEHVVYEQRGKLPIVIIRPSVVISSYNEPTPGWIENFNGPVGLIVASGKGILRTLYAEPNVTADYIPVDVAIRGFIAASWIRGTKKLDPSDDVPVYHCCASSLNQVSSQEVFSIGHEIVVSYPLDNMMWSVGGSISSSKFIYYIQVLLLHVLPAISIDTLLWLLGKKTMIVKIQRRIYSANCALEYYLTQQWTFTNTNFIHLRSKIKKQDEEQFYYEIEGIDRYEFYRNSCMGARRYLLKEKDEDLPKARAHYKRIMLLDKLVKCLFFGCMLWWILHSDFLRSLIDKKMSFLEDRDLQDVPSIPEYHRGKTIFITGGSGFMGKALVEKLLYSCTDLDRIYLLLRPKRGVKPEDRLADVYSSSCFDRLRKERPGVFESKVLFLAGDCAELGLGKACATQEEFLECEWQEINRRVALGDCRGLSEEDRALLVNSTNIVYHVAASVRFDEPLKISAKINLRAAREMIELAKDMRYLESYVHVSTSYCNTNHNPVNEIVYPPLADWRDVLEICDSLDDQALQTMTPKYLGEMPNTYVFTKQLAEHVVYEQRGKLPIVIVRPSIITSSNLEPSPGWIDNFNGPIGLSIASGKGILRSLYARPDVSLDYIPLDMVVRGTIAAAWIRGTKKIEPLDDIHVYQACASSLNQATSDEVYRIGQETFASVPLDNMVWSCGGALCSSKFLHSIEVLFLHVLPALLIDAFLWILGRKTMVVKVQRRIYSANYAVAYYLTKQWTFLNNNFIFLRSKIKEEDKKQFYYGIEGIDKYDYCKTTCLGARRYLLKEKDENLPKARAHYKRITILDQALKCVFYACMVWWFIRSDFVRNIFKK